MNKHKFSTLFEEFDPGLPKTSEELETITKIYPYFQTAHFLYVKSLQSQESINFNSVLEKTAIITYDRNLLMEWINDKFKINKPEKEKKNKRQFKVKQKVENTFQINKEDAKPDFKLKKLSFTEWVSISNKNIQNNFHLSNNDSEHNWRIINSFLKTNPKVSQPKDINLNNTIDLSSESNFSDEELMTETLAKIFFKQEKYEKAHQAYKILSLKYPEKNALFAIQISETKRLMKKMNKK